MKNSKGFTLIELMVVISIMALLLMGSASMIRMLTLSNTNKIVQKIDSEISKNRMLTMSKGNYRFVVISWNATDHEYDISIVTSSTVLNASTWSTGVIESTKKLASEEVTLSYLNSGSAVPVMVKNEALLIHNDPGTGAFMSSCSQVDIMSDSKTKTIYLVTKTGYHYIE